MAASEALDSLQFRNPIFSETLFFNFNILLVATLEHRNRADKLHPKVLVYLKEKLIIDSAVQAHKIELYHCHTGNLFDFTMKWFL